jgi:hypothetical protein
MVDELLCRRSSFRPGSRIRLADGQAWAFPLPTREWAGKAWPAAEEYTGLIQAMIEAEDHAERCLAELAFAIFLLEQNYRLSPVDYQQLLDFGPESQASNDWRFACHQLAQEHLVFLADARGFPLEMELVAATQSRFSRLRAWLRTNMPFRGRFFDSPGC